MRKKNRVTIREAMELTGIGYQAFWRWIKAGYCPLLKGRLKAEQDADGCRSWYLSRRQVEWLAKIAADAPIAREGRFENAVGTWLTATAIERAYPLKRDSIYYWGRYWPPLVRDVNTLSAWFKLSDGRFQDITVYLEADVAEAAAAMMTAKGTDAPPGYMTVSQAARETDYSILGIVRQIKNGNCPILNRAWDSKEQKSPIADNPNRHYIRRGSPHYRNRHFVSIRDVEDVKRRKATGREDEWLTIDEASTRSGYSRDFFHRCCSIGTCRPLHGPLRSEKRGAIDRRGRSCNRWFIHADDVEELRKIRRSRLARTQSADGWFTIYEASIVTGYSANLLGRWCRKKRRPPLGRELKAEQRCAPNGRGYYSVDLWSIHPDDVEDLRRVKRGASPTKPVEPAANETESSITPPGESVPPVAEPPAPEPQRQSPWFDHVPPADSHFQYGPVNGRIKQLSEWVGMSPNTLKGRNGKLVWIRQLNRYSFEAYFDSQQKYAHVNQKAILANARE